MYSSGILPTTSLINQRRTAVVSSQNAGAIEPVSTNSNSSQESILPVSTIENNSNPPKQTNSNQTIHFPTDDQQILPGFNQITSTDEVEKLALQRAIEAYKNNSPPNSENAGSSALQQDTIQKKVAERNILQEIRDSQLLNPNMINYRQTIANSRPSSVPSSADSKSGTQTDNRVLLYNRAITAYIRQKIFFSSITNIGMMTRA
jgi:hypothetical protein